ncbi:MAG: AmmeMemoRadiSam system protein B [Kiritimatiellae bacterium]|nr:AmmeMemoRadiSam system protein B [Kiritimatiellia bacterium]
MTLESSIAGSWYPDTASGIRALAGEWERSPGQEITQPFQRPNVLILPHAGWTYSGETAWSAVRMVKGADFKRVVVLAPSHRAWIENRLVAPKADAVATPLGRVEIDRDWLDRLSLVAPVAKDDRIHRGEHAAQIEYPLLQHALGEGFKIVPLVMGGFGAGQMGMCVRALSRLIDAETLLVVSSDFTHYGTDFSYAPFGTDGGEDVREKVAALDAEALSLISKRDADGFAAFIKRTGATICGHVPIEMALRAFPAGSSVSLVRYATSGDQDRDFRRFVCYAAAAGRIAWPDETDAVLDADARAFLLRLARASLEGAVKSPRSRFAIPSQVPKSVLANMGAFVTLNDTVTGALRGCIGEILPMRPLVEAVAARAVDAALHDPRFPPVSERELSSLRVEVSALTPPKRVASWCEIVLGRDGMTLEKNGRFAVFLPQVAPEQGWDLPTTLSYLSQKAGLAPDAWRDGATFETFQAEVFHE